MYYLVLLEIFVLQSFIQNVAPTCVSLDFVTLFQLDLFNLYFFKETGNIMTKCEPCIIINFVLL